MVSTPFAKVGVEIHQPPLFNSPYDFKPRTSGRGIWMHAPTSTARILLDASTRLDTLFRCLRCQRGYLQCLERSAPRHSKPELTILMGTKSPLITTGLAIARVCHASGMSHFKCHWLELHTMQSIAVSVRGRAGLVVNGWRKSCQKQSNIANFADAMRQLHPAITAITHALGCRELAVVRIMLMDFLRVPAYSFSGFSHHTVRDIFSWTNPTRQT